MNTLLIIDDDVGTRETLQALLASEERRLEFVSNPTKALAIATQLQPDLILLDVLMPGLDGFEICRQIRANPALAEVPILLLTVLDDRDSRLAGIAAGADDFVSKPFDRAELTMRVQSILRLNRYRRLLEERTKVDQLTEYALVVSHELKAPLRGMRQLADWIARDHAARLDSEGQQLFTLLKERVRELDRTIDGLLECARVGKTHQVERQIATGELVREIAEQLALPPLVKITIDPDLPTVNASREQLQQVFQNLLDNALASLDQPQGRLRVSATRRVAAWEFLVADNGRGIPARFLDRVFEPYWRMRRSGDKPGVGLGLTLVKRIVEDRGGAAWVQSREGRGTIVHFTWPDAEVPLRSDAGIVVSALFFKGFTHVVDFLARAYGHLGFGHRRRKHQLQCLEQLLLAGTGFGHLARHDLAAARVNQFHNAELFELAQAFFHRDFQRPPGLLQMTAHF